MLLSYELFVRKHGLRKPMNLMTPIINKEASFNFPRGSIWHYTPVGSEFGPSQEDPYFKDVKQVIPILHLTELASTEGNPRILPGQPQQWIRQFHQKNKQFRKVFDPEVGVRVTKVPFVVNYSLIDRRYRYITNMFSDYNRWLNMTKTILKEVNEIAKETPAQNFIFLELPKVFPSIPLLKQASKLFNTSTMKKFSTPEALMIFEFWKWLGENRSDSLLSMIELENCSRVNFVFKDSGNWITFNLGTLNSWRKVPKGEEAPPEFTPRKGFESKRLQLIFYRYLIKLAAMRAGGEDLLKALDEQLGEKSETETNKEAPEEKKENKELGISDQKDSPVTNEVPEEIEVTEVKPNNGKDLTTTDKKLVVTNNNTEGSIDEEHSDEDDIVFNLDDDEINEIMKDLSAIGDMPDTQEAEASPEENVKDIVDDYTSLKANDISKPEDGIMSAVNELVEAGQLTAAEFRRFEELGKKYKEIKYPGTNKTLADVAKIDKEKLKLEKPKQFKDSVAIFDKSMLESTIHDFDSRYVKEVMESDLASMFLSMQKAGICVTELEKERITDASGEYDQVKLKVQPVEGATSTLWLKLPVIDDEGNFTNNGVKYRLRKQRGDLPIRKIAPDKVSLTSYYGKANVFRSHKKVTDYADWLRNSIMEKGLDIEDKTVEELKPANAFRSDIKAPRLYTALSMRFQSFKLGGYTWYLDYNQHLTVFDQKDINEYEVNGAILVGKGMNNDVLMMDKDSKLYYIKDIGNVRQIIPAPSIEELLGLDPLKAPVDITSIKVLGKLIPIGFLLAYYVGLEKLINSLGVKYRRVPKDGRLDLQPDEWRLAFGDESLIFNRDNKVAMMILGGLKDFHLELKKYSVYEFDRKDVYLNLLEAVGLSARYLREIDLMNKMFIDPITKDILEEMKEPTTFMGLLIRSTELLTTDDHPDEIDPNYMRIKGFERIPGAVYTELVKAIRVQNGRVGKSKVPIDLNPFAVWRYITTDPALITVDEINPIHNLKEAEMVTYGGNGGRTGQTMMKHTREFHKNDLGTVSESTVDSSDVGINVNLSTNPNLRSLRGLSNPIDLNNTKPSSVFSTSFLLAPGADTDDEPTLRRL